MSRCDSHFYDVAGNVIDTHESFFDLLGETAKDTSRKICGAAASECAMSDLDDPDGRRLKNLQDLNRRLDEIIRDGEAGISQLLTHAARASADAAIESQALQRKMTKLTSLIFWLTIVITFLTAAGITCSALQVYYARASYVLGLRQSLHTPPRSGSPPK